MPALALRSDSLAPLAGGTRASFAVRRSDGVGAGYTNSLSGQGSLRDTQLWTSHDPGQRLTSWDVRGLLRADAMAHRICYREPQDVTREGWEVSGTVRGVPLEADAESQKAWSAWFDRLDIPELVVRARATARAFGGAAWVMWVDDGRPSDQPIDWANIRRISWVKVLRGGSQSLVQPTAWIRDPSSPRHGQPAIYNVSFPEGGAGRFYWQRVVIWQGAVTDDEDLVANNGWGESVLDRVWTAVRNFGAAHQYAALALQKLSQGVFQSQYLANALEAGRGEEAKRRLEDVALGMGATGEIGLGPNESYSIIGRPIGGMDGVLAKMAEALVASTDMPEIVLMGRRPGGLSTAADGEFRGWYDYCSSLQPTHYTPPLLRLVEVASRALEGPTSGIPVLDAGIHWPQLWQLTESEKLDNRAKAAAARAADIGSGAVTVEEARTDPELDQWYQLGALQPPPEDEALAEGPEPAQDLAVLPPGDELISMRETANILGYKTTRAARNLASQLGALFEPVAGTFRVARGMLLAALRSSRVEQPAAEPAPVEPA